MGCGFFINITLIVRRKEQGDVSNKYKVAPTISTTISTLVLVDVTGPTSKINLG